MFVFRLQMNPRRRTWRACAALARWVLNPSDSHRQIFSLHDQEISQLTTKILPTAVDSTPGAVLICNAEQRF